MKVLITGASGFIGGYVVREAVAHGHWVVALSRSKPASPPGQATPIEWLQCDLGSAELPKLTGLGIDAVIRVTLRGERSARENWWRAFFPGASQVSRGDGANKVLFPHAGWKDNTSYRVQVS